MSLATALKDDGREYPAPLSYGSLTKEEFDMEIKKGLDDVSAGRVYSADFVEAEMKREFSV